VLERIAEIIGEVNVVDARLIFKFWRRQHGAYSIKNRCLWSAFAWGLSLTRLEKFKPQSFSCQREHIPFVF